MLPRTARGNVRTASVRLGELRLDVSDHDAPDGTLRTCENLRPAGPPKAPYYTPVAPSTDVVKMTAFDTPVLALGSFATEDSEEYVAVTAEKVWSVDTATFTPTPIYTFGAEDATRKAQFAAVGTKLLIAVSKGAGVGEPEITLVYDGSDCKRLYVPDLPYVEVTSATEVAAGGLSDSSVYGYRIAWVMEDGSFGPPSAPIFFSLGANTGSNTGWSVDFQYIAHPSEDNPTDSAYWGANIRGLAIFMTEAIAQRTITSGGDVSHFFGESYFLIHVADRPSELIYADTLITWSGTDAEIAAGETLDSAENLMQHTINAASCFAYNARALLGDVSYDFRKPNALAMIHASDTERSSSGDYAIRIGVTIRTNKGEFQRISDPVYVTAATAALLEIRGMYDFANSAWAALIFMYPDPRVVQFQIYVDNDNDGEYELFDTYEAHPSVAGNFAWAYDSGTELDLTGTLGTSMPDEDAKNAEVDYDPNRMLVSREFQVRDFPASSAFYVTRSDADPILAFEANTREVSDGQFGFAPFLVICRRSVKAMESSASGTLSRAVPVAERGAVGRYATTNANGLIFFASDDGIWTLSPQISREPVTAPIHAFDAQNDVLDSFSADTTLAYTDDGRGNRDLWVGGASTTYVLSLDYGRWFTTDRSRRSFMRSGIYLFGYDPDREEITEELQASGVNGVDFTLVTAPIKLDEPGVVKRLYRLAVRQRQRTDYRGGIDQIEYVVFDPLDDDQLGGEEDLTLDGETALAAFQRLVAIDSLTVADAAALTIDDDANLFGIDSDEGALVAAGTMTRTLTSDVASLHAGVMRDAYVILRGTGKPGQGIEGLDFDYEPRLLHRARRRNY